MYGNLTETDISFIGVAKADPHWPNQLVAGLTVQTVPEVSSKIQILTLRESACWLEIMKSGFMNKVGIVVPFFKNQSYFYRLVDSILAQDSDSWLLTIVDDSGGRDLITLRTDIARDPRVDLVVNGHNLGLGKSWNTGLESMKSRHNPGSQKYWKFRNVGIGVPRVCRGIPSVRYV